jgi:hypothetical protein
MVAMAVCFILLTVIVQAAFLLVARETGSAAAAAAARAAARTGASEHVGEDLLAELVRAVPGAASPTMEIAVGDRVATASISFDWRPPGPDLARVRLTMVGSAPVVSPP